MKDIKIRCSICNKIVVVLSVSECASFVVKSYGDVVCEDCFYKGSDVDGESSIISDINEDKLSR